MKKLFQFLVMAYQRKRMWRFLRFSYEVRIRAGALRRVL